MAGSSPSARAPSWSRPPTARASPPRRSWSTARNVQRALELVGRTPAEDFQTLEQWTFGDYLYATSALSGKLWVYDITNPVGAGEGRRAQLRRAHPERRQRHRPTARSACSRARARRTARTASSFSTRPTRRIPKVLSEYTETVSGGVHSAFIDGHYVYLTDDATGSMRVIDFEDPKAPKEVGRWELSKPDAKVFGKRRERPVDRRALPARRAGERRPALRRLLARRAGDPRRRQRHQGRQPGRAEAREPVPLQLPRAVRPGLAGRRARGVPLQELRVRRRRGVPGAVQPGRARRAFRSRASSTSSTSPTSSIRRRSASTTCPKAARTTCGWKTT